MSATIAAPHPISCPGCHLPIVDPTATQCACGCALTPSQTPQLGQLRGMVPPVAKRAKPAVMAVIHSVVDRTASTFVFEKYIPEAIEYLLGTVLPDVASVKSALYTAGDLDEGEDVLCLAVPGPVTTGATGNIVSDAMEHAALIRYGGGGDIPETHLDNLHRVLQMIPPAQTFERHVVVGFLTDPSKPLASGMTPAELGALFHQRKIDVHLACNPCPLLAEFVNAANGSLVALSNPPSQISRAELQKVAVAIGRTISSRTT